MMQNLCADMPCFRRPGHICTYINFCLSIVPVDLVAGWIFVNWSKIVVSIISIWQEAVAASKHNTVYGKTFEEENFSGFRGVLANRESFPLESFAVYST